MGGYERDPMPWALDGIPADFNHRLLDPDWPRFERDHGRRDPPGPRDRRRRRDPDDQRPRGVHARQRVHPRRERRARAVRRRRLLRPRHRGRRRHRPPGGGVDRRRRARARPVEDGHPPLRRAVPQPRATRSRGRIENYATYYDIHYPNEERRAGRPLRLSPAYARLAALGAVVRREGGRGSGRTGSSRTRRRGRGDGGRPRGAPAARLGRASTGARRSAPRRWRRGRTAGAVRRDVVRQDRGRGPGRRARSCSACAPTTSTGAVGTRHLHPAAQPPRRHRVRPHGHPRHARPLPARHRHGVRQPRPRLDPAPPAGATGRCVLNDVTSAARASALWGPRARDILASTTTDDVSDAAFPYLTARAITVGDVPVYALRVTYVGELGWELYAHAEYGAALWDTLWAAGAPHGLVAGGYRAIDALRLEKGYRAWAADITPEETPYEAGLGFAVAPRQGGDFLGRDALVVARAAGPRQAAALPRARRSALGLPGQRARPHRAARIVGRVTSGGYGFSVGRSIAYAYLPPGRRHRQPRRGRRVRDLGRLRGRAGSRCSTRPARGSGREQGIIGAMTDDADARYGPAWSAVARPRARGAAPRVAGLRARRRATPPTRSRWRTSGGTWTSSASRTGRS